MACVLCLLAPLPNLLFNKFLPSFLPSIRHIAKDDLAVDTIKKSGNDASA